MHHFVLQAISFYRSIEQLHRSSTLDSLVSKVVVQEFNSQQLKSCLWSKTCPNWYELFKIIWRTLASDSLASLKRKYIFKQATYSTPEWKNSPLLNSLLCAISKTIIDLCISRLVHQLCSQHIPRENEYARVQVSSNIFKSIISINQIHVFTYQGATVMVINNPAMKLEQKVVFGSFLFHPVELLTYPFAIS